MQARSFTRKELKQFRKDGLSITKLMNQEYNVDEMLDIYDMFADVLEIPDATPQSEANKIVIETIKLTFGAEDEVKNSGASARGTGAKKDATGKNLPSATTKK